MTHISKMELNILMGTSHQRLSHQTPMIQIKIISAEEPSTTKALMKLRPSNRVCDLRFYLTKEIYNTLILMTKIS